MDTAAALEMEWVSSFANSLSDFDIKMNDIVVESKILSGVTQDDLVEAGRRVALQSGCRETLIAAQRSGIDTRIISVNWSATLVQSALQLECLVGEDPASPTRMGRLLLYANELEFDERGSSTGQLVRSVQTAHDKCSVFNDALLNRAARKGGVGGFAVYVGDSPPDVYPLLGADVGIVLGSNEALRRVLRAVGVVLKPLVAAPLEAPQVDEVAAGTLYEASSWAEISAYLFSSSFVKPAASSTTQPTDGRTTDMESDLICQESVCVPKVLTIAGSDCGGGAGIQADLKTFSAAGTYGMSVITALTAQNTHGVHGVHSVDAEFVAKQLDAVFTDMGVDALKTGMLPNADVIRMVARKIRQYGVSNVVVDPVMVATSGHALTNNDVVSVFKEELFPVATIVTPNIPEASALLGGRNIVTEDDMVQAARDLHAFGCRCVLVKGGHLMTRTASAQPLAVDVLYDGVEARFLSAPAVVTANTHGTGCTLAAAIAAELAKGAPLFLAVSNAKHFLTRCLQASKRLRFGTGKQQPMHHGFEIVDWAAALDVAMRSRRSRSCDLRVYAVTDAACNEKAGRNMLEAVQAAIKGGATVIQVREKGVDGGEFARIVADVIACARPLGVAVIVNDRVDVALATSADGVHIGQDDIAAAVVRRMIPSHMMLGVSVKSPEQALQAAQDGADYVGAGAVYSTATKESAAIGLDGLASICRVSPVPVVAIGGLHAGNAAQCIHVGAAGVAVVSAIFAVADAAAATAEIRASVDKALALA